LLQVILVLLVEFPDVKHYVGWFELLMVLMAFLLWIALTPSK